jgi:hypothetical protein
MSFDTDTDEADLDQLLVELAAVEPRTLRAMALYILRRPQPDCDGGWRPRPDERIPYNLWAEAFAPPAYTSYRRADNDDASDHQDDCDGRTRNDVQKPDASHLEALLENRCSS